MTVDLINISSYGLRLLEVKDYIDLPKRKDILEVPEFTANDIKTESLSFTIELYGKWNSVLDRETALSGFDTLVKSAVQHSMEITEYNIPAFSGGVFADGYKVDFWDASGKSAAKITAKITVANLKWIANVEA